MEKYIYSSLYSLDMLRVNFRVSPREFQSIQDIMSVSSEVTQWESSSFNSYRYNYRVACGSSAFWIGYVPNWVGGSVNSSKLLTVEFNPNKVGGSVLFGDVYGLILRLCRFDSVVRFDLAMDIPVSRDKVHLVKDKRKYKEERNSMLDRTQYLGTRNSMGFVKVYNKQLEAGLSFDLTRIELTVSYNEREKIEQYIPLIYVLDDIEGDTLDISGTDKVLLLACLNDMSMIDLLSRDKKKKIKEYLRQCSNIFKFERNKYVNILDYIAYYTDIGLFSQIKIDSEVEW